MISKSSNNSDLSELLAASESYLLERQEALNIIEEVKKAVSFWRETAKEIGISKAEQQRFAYRFEAQAD